MLCPLLCNNLLKGEMVMTNYEYGFHGAYCILSVMKEQLTVCTYFVTEVLSFLQGNQIDIRKKCFLQKTIA